VGGTTSDDAADLARFRDALAAARLRAADQVPYLATALFALTPVVTPHMGTFGVDRHWRLYADPVTADRWTVEEMAAVLVHEVNHLLRDHAGRAGAMGVDERTHGRFNVAADMEINDDLSDLPLPAGACLPLQFGAESGQLVEAYFVWLEATQLGPELWECGSGAHGQTRPWDLPVAATTAVGDAEGELIRQHVAVEIRAYANGRGTVPGGLARWASAFLEPRVDWRRALGSAIRSGVVDASGAVDFTYRRPNRRTGSMRGRRVVQPALRQPIPRVAVVVDTSGSMSALQLEQALAEIRGVLRGVSVTGEHLAVLSCDAAVRATQRVFSASAVALVGGGGTDMGAGLIAAAALRPVPDVVIVLTDGLTPWPSTAPAGRRVVVGLLGDVGSAPTWARSIRIPVGIGG
jgi:predicted metal-dependent peptidase